MYASDYRAQAKQALRGKWKRMAWFTFLAMLLGAGAVGGASGVSFSASDLDVILEGEMTPEMFALWLTIAMVGLCISLWTIFMGSWVRVGMTGMANRLIGGETPRAGMLFPKGIYWKTVGLNFMKNLFIALWSLLLIIPGIIAIYRYSMAEYLLYNHPEMSIMEAMAESKRCMHGRKWRSFCLQLSFIGWNLLCGVPAWLMLIAAAIVGEALLFAPDEVVILMIMVAMFIGGIISAIASMFVTAYMNTAQVAFFRDAQRAARWQDEAREGEAYAEENHGFMEDVRENASAASAAVPHYAQPAPPQSVLTADETVARDVFMQHKCSRRRMMEEGVLEEYKAMQVSPIAEVRWIREYGDTLMLRFDRDANALDEILNLCAEYALDELVNRALMRIERHIRRESLPDGEILNMCGRVLAMVTSGVFDENEAFIDRKKEQISDMADRLEHRLNENAPEGEWKNALQLLRGML